jgi:hypothetical protein
MAEHVAIPLGDHWSAYIDHADLDRVSAYRWRYKIDGNRIRAVRDYSPDGHGKWWSTQSLEAFLLGLMAPMQTVKFKDGNCLHCWRDNMEPLGKGCLYFSSEVPQGVSGLDSPKHDGSVPVVGVCTCA